MDKQSFLALYEKMYALRKMDEKIFELKLQDLVMDGFHPYSGEEAIGVAAGAALNADDYMVSNHRPQGHAFGKGVSARKLFAEFLGRKGGCCDGIGGPMQFIDVDNNFFCGSIVGSGITDAAGIAFALKRENKGRICVSYFGDGASNTGSFHEGLNDAAIWKLPVVYILENNLYAEAMPVEEFVSAKPISNRAVAYGIEGITIDGNDVELVYDTVKKAVEKARRGEGPTLIECVTYRFRGHYGGDQQFTYRTKEEIEEHRAHDPLLLAEQKMAEMGIEQAVIDEIHDRCEKEIESAAEWGIAQPFITLEEATANVLVEE